MLSFFFRLDLLVWYFHVVTTFFLFDFFSHPELSAHGLAFWLAGDCSVYVKGFHLDLELRRNSYTSVV